MLSACIYKPIYIYIYWLEAAVCLSIRGRDLYIFVQPLVGGGVGDILHPELLRKASVLWATNTTMMQNNIFGQVRGVCVCVWRIAGFAAGSTAARAVYVISL